MVRTVNRTCIPQWTPSVKEFKTHGAGDGCPVEFAACLTRDNLVALVIYLDELKQWNKEAVTLCR